MDIRGYEYLRNLTWILVLIAIGMIAVGEINPIIRKRVILLMSISAGACVLVRDYGESNRRKNSLIVAAILIISAILIWLT